MSRASVIVPRVAWLAVGTALGAAGPTLGVPPWAMSSAGLAFIAAGSAASRGLAPPRRAALMALGLGLLVVAGRLAFGPASTSPAALPDDLRGPWSATVESVGSPREGHQVARLGIDADGGEVLVAATLPAFPALAAGDRVEVAGRLEPPPDDDPYGAYLRRSGVSGSLDARSLSLVAPAPATLQSARDAAGDALRVALPEPEAGLAAGILIGLRERVDRDLAAAFATAGVSHVVAISGWNIAIVAGIVGAILRGRPRRLVAIIVGGTIAAYVIAAGGSPSVVRAAVMASVVLLARETGRAGRAPAALAWAVVVLLLGDPGLIGDAGFRLSVLATAGLLGWANPLAGWLGRMTRGHVPGWLIESLGISLAAQLATLPDVLATFGRLSIVAPVVNLLVVPLVPVAMAGGVVALLCGWLTTIGAPGWVGTLGGLPGWLVLHVIVAIVRIAAAIPFAAVALPPALSGPMGVASALAIAGGAWWARAGRTASRRGGAQRAAVTRLARAAPKAGRPGSRTRAAVPPRVTASARMALIALAIAVGLASVAAANVAGRATRLTVLDVGQGDAILVESRTGARMLIDGGPDPERILTELDARIPPWDRRLDVVVLTHPHEDHVAGLARVLERYAVGRVYEPGMHGPGPGWAAWDAELRDGPPRQLLSTGAHLRLGEISLSVLWPDAGRVPIRPPDGGTGINNVSIVFLGEANGRRFLLMGDVEQGIDPELLARGIPRVDVLKIAHHGSATASTQAFVDAARPRVAIASAGAGNPYGHPASSTLDRIRSAGARVLRTDRDGSVELDLREDGVVVHASGGRQAGQPRTAVLASASNPGAGAPAPASLFACGIGRAVALAGPSSTRPTTVPALVPPDARPWRVPGGRGPDAVAVPLGYDRSHDLPGAPRGRQPVALPRSPDARLAARVRRGGRRGVACGADRLARRAGRRGPGRGGGAPARCRQAAGDRDARPPPARGGIGRVAHGTRPAGARAAGSRPPGDAAR